MESLRKKKSMKHVSFNTDKMLEYINKKEDSIKNKVFNIGNKTESDRSDKSEILSYDSRSLDYEYNNDNTVSKIFSCISGFFIIANWLWIFALILNIFL